MIGTTVERLLRQSPVPVLLVRNKPAGSYRRVLIATNLSSASSRATRAAALVARGAKVNVVNVFETAFPVFMHPDDAAIANFKCKRVEEITRQIHQDLGVRHKGRTMKIVGISIVRDEVIHGIFAAIDVNRHRSGTPMQSHLTN